MAKPRYVVERLEDGAALSRSQLDKVLTKLPISIGILTGHKLTTQAQTPSSREYEKPYLLVSHYAQIIELRPEAGKRLADGSFVGAGRNFHPSRIMDECTGGGACSSYEFNTGDLGLPFRQDLMLDIKKLG